MDEIAVPISWFRQPGDQDTLGVDTMYVRENELPSTDPTLQGNKQPAVAVYLLQFYPVTQACVQPCVTATTNSQLTATVIPQVPLQQSASTGTCFVSHPTQVCSAIQNVNTHLEEGKQTTVKLEPICVLAKQQEIEQEPNQCLLAQENLGTPLKVPLVQKWREEGSAREHHITVLTTRSQENLVQSANQGTQHATESRRTVSNSSSSYATEMLQAVEHNMRTQAEEKPYSCNVCGKVFVRAHNLKAHSQTHSGALPFPCKICRKSYSQEAYYRIHSEILSGGRPYTCDVCSKVFCNSRSFNFHVRSHSRRCVLHST